MRRMYKGLPKNGKLNKIKRGIKIMTYHEERLAIAETQLDLVVAGFEPIVKDLISKGGDNLADKLQPYVEAIKELKGSVAYLRDEVEKEKAKAE